MSTFLNYPVIRLTIYPGEGCLVPTDNIIYDFTTLEKEEPDINLGIHASFNTQVNP